MIESLKENEQGQSKQQYQNETRLCKSCKLHVMHVYCSNTPTNLD